MIYFPILRATFRKTALAAAICVAPTFCFAQEVFGTLNASLDGVERTWFLTTHETDSQSFGMTMAMANLQSFSLWGQPTDETVNEIEDSLLLSFDVMTVGDNIVPLNASLTYLADGWKSGWLSNEADQIALTLTKFEEQDDGFLVEGDFTAVANYSDALSSGQFDPSQTMQINGTFSASLPNFIIKTQ